MKLCKDDVTDTLAELVYESSDTKAGWQAAEAMRMAEKSRISALPDAVILASYFETKDWAQRVADGYTVEMIDGFNDNDETYNIDEIKVIVQSEKDYGFNIFAQPYNKFTKKMMSNDQHSTIVGFQDLEDECDGTAEWMICFDDMSQLAKVKHQLELMDVSFVVRDMEADDAFDFGEDK